MSPRPTVSISASTPNPAPNAPVTFTIRTTPATGNTIVSVLVEYGDGKAESLSGGETSVSHVYLATGSYRVRATAVDDLGGSGSAEMVVMAGVGGDAD